MLLTDAWNSQLMAIDGAHVPTPAISNIGDWDTVVGEVRRCLTPRTLVNGPVKASLYCTRCRWDVKPLNQCS